MAPEASGGKARRHVPVYADRVSRKGPKRRVMPDGRPRYHGPDSIGTGAEQARRRDEDVVPVLEEAAESRGEVGWYRERSLSP